VLAKECPCGFVRGRKIKWNCPTCQEYHQTQLPSINS
jgi:hypothetical protein